MFRNRYPANLMSTVIRLWRDLYNATPEGLQDFTEALFNIRWVAENVPFNPRTLQMMAKMVRDL